MSFEVEVSTGRQVTYGELKNLVTRVAGQLRKEQIVDKGTVVLVYSPNCIDFAVMYLAVTLLGGIVSAVNPAYTVGKP